VRARRSSFRGRGRVRLSSKPAGRRRLRVEDQSVSHEVGEEKKPTTLGGGRERPRVQALRAKNHKESPLRGTGYHFRNEGNDLQLLSKARISETQEKRKVKNTDGGPG